MMDLETIREFQADAAAIAARQKKQPFLMEASDVGNIDSLRRIPNLGTYLPQGWERIDIDDVNPPRNDLAGGTVGNDDDGPNRRVKKYWVDKSGWGAPDEPALTIYEFADLLKPGYGYAIVEEGQFQIGIGVFKKL